MKSTSRIFTTQVQQTAPLWTIVSSLNHQNTKDQ